MYRKKRYTVTKTFGIIHSFRPSLNPLYPLTYGFNQFPLPNTQHCVEPHFISVNLGCWSVTVLQKVVFGPSGFLFVWMSPVIAIAFAILEGLHLTQALHWCLLLVVFSGIHCQMLQFFWSCVHYIKGPFDFKQYFLDFLIKLLNVFLTDST